jgi:hypothetical protein
VTIIWRNIKEYCQNLSLNLQRNFASQYKQLKWTPANASQSSTDCATERTSQRSEVGIILLRPLKMKGRPLRSRETLTLSHSATISEILIITAIENFFSQSKKSFLRAESSNTPAPSYNECTPTHNWTRFL